MKIVINKSYGGFHISTAAKEWMEKKYGSASMDRTSDALIDCIMSLGTARASGHNSSLKVVDIPDNVDWMIENYDGIEWVSEKHRTWG